MTPPADAEVPGRSPETPLFRAHRAHRDQPRRSAVAGRDLWPSPRLGDPGRPGRLSAEESHSRAVIDARFSPDGKWLGVLAVDLPPEQYVLPTGRVRDSTAFLEIWDLAAANASARPNSERLRGRTCLPTRTGGRSQSEWMNPKARSPAAGCSS